MNVSLNWLRELVAGLSASHDEVAGLLSMTAAAVEGIEPVGADLDGIVVARVAEARPHPNADRLTLCRVEAGGPDAIDVVCGAPVVIEGALYPYVAAGGSLPGGFRIESRKIRGETSHGMLCSEAELELGRDKGGIMRLPDGLEVGAPLTDVLGLPDVRLTLDLNPNRVDLACHLGVARELSPALDEIVLRDFGGPAWKPSWHDGESEASGAGVTVRIEAPDRCWRYMGAVVRGVSVGPSPAWLAGRLLAVGARPINNVVDATNYVLLERNQPLHAFDLATLAGSEIRVRAARPGELLTTLDGERRELSDHSTVIADRDRAVALAGVMGGRDTEVTSETVDVLIECASFDPLGVRNTARESALSTDASYRFERGIDLHAQEAALARCVELILGIAGGEADADAIRVGPQPEPLPELPLRRSRIVQVLGIDLEDAEVEGLLAPIGFDVTGPAASEKPSAEGDLRVAVPGWRRDVTREIDLVEEVARRFGFDNFPQEDRRFRPSVVPDDPAWERADRVRRFFSASGLLEARSLSFVPEEHRGNRAEVSLPNPLSAEESCLRAAIVPVLLRRAEHNFARGRRDIRLYEIGTVFRYADGASAPGASTKGGGLERFHEEIRVGALLTGARDPQHWSAEDRDLDTWDLKGLAASAARELAGARLVAEGDADPRATALAGAWLEPESFRIVKDDRTLGVAGRVRPSSIDAPPWAAAVWALEFELEAVELERTVTYTPLSAFPAVRRDLAVAVPVSAAARRIEEAITGAASELLDEVRLFDVYEGEGVEEGRKSLAWAFRFRAPDRTLTDREVEAEMQAITAILQEQFDARVRSS